MDSTFKLKPEEQLLLCCARTEMDIRTENKIISLVNNDLDWAYLIQIAGKHKLRSLLYLQLNKICGEDVPDGVMAELNDYIIKNAYNNLLMFKELLKILKIFKRYSINCIPYKGPVLAMNVYENLSLREFNDLDIFVYFEDVLKVKELLLKEGYISDFQLEPKKEKKFIKTQRDLKFFNAKLGIILEIHWTFHSLYLSLPSSTKLWDYNNTILLEMPDVEIMNPSHEDMFLILCLHNASHRWNRLSWLCDLYIFVTFHSLDWEKIMIKSKRLVIERILLLNLDLVNDLWGWKIPVEVLKYSRDQDNEKLVQKIEKQIFSHKSSINLKEEIVFSLKLREKIIYGLKDVLRGISTPGVCEWKTLSLPVFLWFLYSFYRPFNLMRRYKKKSR